MVSSPARHNSLHPQTLMQDSHPRPQLIRDRLDRTCAAPGGFAARRRRRRPRRGLARSGRSLFDRTIEVPFPPRVAGQRHRRRRVPPGRLVPAHVPAPQRRDAAAAAPLRRGRLPGARCGSTAACRRRTRAAIRRSPPTSPPALAPRAAQVLVVRAEDDPHDLTPAPRQAGLAARAARHLVRAHDRHLAAGLAGAGARDRTSRSLRWTPDLDRACLDLRCGCASAAGRAAAAPAAVRRHPARRGAGRRLLRR